MERMRFIVFITFLLFCSSVAIASPAKAQRTPPPREPVTDFPGAGTTPAPPPPPAPPPLLFPRPNLPGEGTQPTPPTPPVSAPPDFPIILPTPSAPPVSAPPDFPILPTPPVNSPQQIPEPSSVVSIFAMGVLGVSSALRHQKNKKKSISVAMQDIT